MIDVIQPFGKLEYIINLYQRDSKQLCHDPKIRNYHPIHD